MGLTARRHDDCDSVSATDLLDSYLEKQLTGVTDHVCSPQQPEKKTSLFVRYPLDQGIRSTNRVSSFLSSSPSSSLEETKISNSHIAKPLPSEKGMESTELAGGQERCYRQSMEDESVADREKIEDLRNRCRLMERDLDPSEKLEYESEDLLKKLERLKDTCRRVISWERRPVHPSSCPSTIFRSEADIVNRQKSFSDRVPVDIHERMTSCSEPLAANRAARGEKYSRLKSIKQQVMTDLSRQTLGRYLNFEWQRDDGRQLMQSQSLMDPSSCRSSSNDDNGGSVLMAEDIRKKYPDLFECLEESMPCSL